MRINRHALTQWLLLLITLPIWLPLLIAALIRDAWDELRPKRPADTCRHCHQPLPPSHQCGCQSTRHE